MTAARSGKRSKPLIPSIDRLPRNDFQSALPCHMSERHLRVSSSSGSCPDSSNDSELMVHFIGNPKLKFQVISYVSNDTNHPTGIARTLPACLLINMCSIDMHKHGQGPQNPYQTRGTLKKSPFESHPLVGYFPICAAIGSPKLIATDIYISLLKYS